jgi:3-oxoacyl-[acyl-carrier-protein] synthase II
VSAARGRRVVVTGVGAVSSIGIGRDRFWDGLRRGACGIRDITRFDPAGVGRRRGGEIADFDVRTAFPGEPALEELGRAKQMMLVAARECIGDAGFDPSAAPFEAGVAIGTTMGEAQTFERIIDAIDASGLGAIDARDLADYPPESIPEHVARRFGFHGPNHLVANACAAGNFSIGQATFAIRTGECSAMLVGGADSFSRYAFAGFCRVGAVAPDVPRPFSKNRRGMIPGEGAAALLLESYDAARARGAEPYAEVIGYAESCDARHITQPHDEGIERAMRRALASAAIEPDAIDCVSVHGTGTEANDTAEARAVRRVFGDRRVPVSAAKSMLGHAMGAASALECVAMILAIEHQFLIPTAHFEEADPACDVDCVPNVGRAARITHVLKTASAFGGNNASVVLRAWPR